MQKLSDAFQTGARAVPGGGEDGPLGSAALLRGPLGMDSGEGTHRYSGSPTPTFISRRGRGRAAVCMTLLVKYLRKCVYSLG